jgi:hypothetical protein
MINSPDARSAHPAGVAVATFWREVLVTLLKPMGRCVIAVINDDSWFAQAALDSGKVILLNSGRLLTRASRRPVLRGDPGTIRKFEHPAES